jgi:hypothetical protein
MNSSRGVAGVVVMLSTPVWRFQLLELPHRGDAKTRRNAEKNREELNAVDTCLAFSAIGTASPRRRGDAEKRREEQRRTEKNREELRRTEKELKKS